MGVALQAALGVTVGLLVAGKVPDDQVLVATAREQHVGAKLQSKKRAQVRTDFPNFFLNIMNSTVSPKTISFYFIIFACHFFTVRNFPYFSKEVAREVTQPL